MIDIINVSKTYNGIKVVDNVNIFLPRYGLVIINGPSGCGKTTLLNILSTLLEFEGDISFDGKRYQSLAEVEKEAMRNKRIGFVFQDYKLFEFETVKENIMLSINLCSVDKENKKEKRVDDLLKLVGLFDKKNELVSNLSGGEKQRVAIARAMANSPSLLLADEPTGNLDEKNSKNIMELLRKISSSSLVVMVSHDVELTNKYADRIIKMKDGKILSDRYQNKNKHKEYLPILKLNYDDKKRKLPFKFFFSHTLNSIKRRRWRTMFITFSTSLGLIGVGLATALSEIISSNLYRSYSSIIESDKVVIANKNQVINRDIVTSASLSEVLEFTKTNPNIKNIGVYYWNVGDIFKDDNYICLDLGGNKKPVGNYTCHHVNQFALLETNKNEVYPKNSGLLADNEVILSMPMLVINEFCYQLQITRTIESFSNYLSHHEVVIKLNFSNNDWGYSAEIPLILKGFILSNKSLMYHTNTRWNEYIFEECCQLPSTNYINVNTSHPWDLKKSYYMELSNKRDEFLIQNRFSIDSGDYDFELIDKKYCPLLYEDVSSYLSNRLMVIHRSNKDDIPSYFGNYFRQSSKYIHEFIYGSNNGYSIYEQSLMMGFSKSTFLSNKEEYILDIVDEMSYIKYEDSINTNIPSQIIEGHFSKSGTNGLTFESHYRLITGREPANFQEILVSEAILRRLNITDPINKFIYLSFPTKEDLLSNGYLSRKFETVALKIVGITDSGKLSISHDESWTVLFFQTMLGVSTFDLRINNIAIRVSEGKEDVVINKISRAFPHFSISAPLKEIKSSVDQICGYIETILLVVSVTSVIIAALILFICNYLHYVEVKKDIGLVRCLGAKEKESRKFIYSHSIIMTGLSFIFSSIELLVVSVVLSKVMADTLYIESKFVFNPLSLVYMFAVAGFISLVSSLLISKKISKIDALSCLK